MNKLIFVAAVLLLIAAPFVVTAETKEDKIKDFVCVDKGKTKLEPPAPPGAKIKDIKVKLCDNGKVPRSVIESDNTPPSPIWQYNAWYDYAQATKNGLTWGLGVRSLTQSQTQPFLDSTDKHSLAELAISNNRSDIVELGWRKTVGLNTRVFSYIWINGHTTCYTGSPQCNNGYVQTGSTRYPGMVVTGDMFSNYYIWLWEGDWWIWYQDEWMGYYPASVWGENFLDGWHMYAYGELAAGTNPSYSDMGNGVFANSTDPQPAHFYYIEWYPNDINQAWTWWTNPLLYATTPSKYSVQGEPSWYGFKFGGPGLE